MGLNIRSIECYCQAISVFVRLQEFPSYLLKLSGFQGIFEIIFPWYLLTGDIGFYYVKGGSGFWIFWVRLVVFI